MASAAGIALILMTSALLLHRAGYTLLPPSTWRLP